MAESRIGGVRLAYAVDGSGAPIVFVHGSWGDHHNWDPVVQALTRTLTVVCYDRRGHSDSERLSEQGHVEQDVDDLEGLIEHLGLAPAHIVGNSFGAIIVLRLAARRPALFRTMIVHEPPLVALLASDPAMCPVLAAVDAKFRAVIELLLAGEDEAAAQRFVEDVALGPGAWQTLPPPVRATFVRNAPTWLDEMRDPNALTFDPAVLSHFDRPALVSDGAASPPFFGAIVETIAAALPRATRYTFARAGHVPHLTDSEEYVRVVTEFIARR